MKIYRGDWSSKMTQGLADLTNYIEGNNLIIAEIGSANGESTSIFSRSEKISKIFCIDMWKLRDVENEFDRKNIPKVIKIKSSSEEAAPEFPDREFDLIYIDASHGYEHIKKDIELWLPKTKRYISGHDYTFKFMGVIQSVCEKFNRPDFVFGDGSWMVDLMWKPKYYVNNNCG